MGNLYKRGNIWWIKYYRAGESYRESSNSEKESEAKRLLKLREGQIVEGRFPGLMIGKIAYEELSNDLINDYRINKRKSLERAVMSLKHLASYFADKKAASITSDVINEYIVIRQGTGAKNGTINRELSALKRMFTLASRQTPPKVTSVPYIPKLKESVPRQGFFEYQDYIKLKIALPEYLQPVLTMAYLTGMRKSEMLNLTWSQTNIFEKKITLDADSTKNGETRLIFLTGELFEVILKQKKIRDNHFPECPYVFSRDGKQIRNYQAAWHSSCRKAGLIGKLLHDTRRTAVRNMSRSGIPETVAMRISGHKTRSVFDRYNITSEEDLRLAAEKIEKLFRKRASSLSRSSRGHNLGTMTSLGEMP
jgi:integrase